MKKVNITISYDEEKLNALRLYLEQKGVHTEDELSKALDTLYSKTVPAGVREFIELRSGNAPAKQTVLKPKKPKAVPSSTVGEAGHEGTRRTD